MKIKKITVSDLYEKEIKKFENMNLLSDFKMSYCLISSEDIIFTGVLDGRIIGMAAIHKVGSQHYESLFVEVLPEHRGKKISTMLIEERYKFLQKEQAKLTIPNYTDIGRMTIKYYDEVFSKKYRVDVTPKAKNSPKP